MALRSEGVAYCGGRIWTGDVERPDAEALLVRDGRIVALGESAQPVGVVCRRRAIALVDTCPPPQP